jgi:hypothetical protein
MAKYGNYILNNAKLSCEPTPYYASLWWKDVCNLDVCLGSSNWLEEVLVRRLGNDMLTRFWRMCGSGMGRYVSNSHACSRYLCKKTCVRENC